MLTNCLFYVLKRKKGKRDIVDNISKELERRTKDHIDASVKQKFEQLQKMLTDAASAQPNGKTNSLVFVILV